MKSKNKIKKIPFIPKSQEYPNYSDKNFWRIRYDNTKNSFDWYEDYETLSPIIKQLNLSKRSTILHIGIGNSEFSEKMYDEGYKKSYNIDFARNVIHYMKQRNKRLRSNMIFETMNVLNLNYEDNQFDIVFDKAVFDCVLCGIDADSKANKFMKEIYRVLKPNGYYFLVSNTGPENGLNYIQNKNIKYDIFVYSILSDKKQTDSYKDNDTEINFLKKIYYIYVCKKIEEIENNKKEENEDKNKRNEIKEKITEKDKISDEKKNEVKDNNFDNNKKNDETENISEGQEKNKSMFINLLSK
jgi:ubiquinone/menaquinone biosynthesis C-methylase UbiE